VEDGNGNIYVTGLSPKQLVRGRLCAC
jgi:hypothetical protein